MGDPLVLDGTKEGEMMQKKDSPNPGGTRFGRALRRLGLLLVALALAALVGSAGCAGCVGASNPKATRAIEALEEKYGESFELKSYSRWASGVGASEYIDCYPLSQPDLVFAVEFDSDGRMYDTYLERKIGRELENIVLEKTAAQGFVVEPHVSMFFYLTERQPDSSVTYMTLEEYLRDYRPKYMIVSMIASGRQGFLHGSDEFMQALQDVYDAIEGKTELFFSIRTVDPDDFEEFRDWIRDNDRFYEDIPGKTSLVNGHISFEANSDGVIEREDLAE
jgi:hypothetical protein